MTFTTQITLGDIATACGSVFAAVGLILTWREVRRASKQRRSEFAANVVFRFLGDPSACEAFYRLEHEKVTFETLRETPDAVSLDKLLYHFETVGSLYYMGAITFNDVLLLDYEITQVYRNQAVNEYLAYLDPLCRSAVSDIAFPRFRRLAKEIVQHLGNKNVPHQ